MDLFVTTDSEGVYMGMTETPSGERIHIGFFGRRNAGKSSLVNAVTGQDLSIVSEVRGTTTDPVSKSMELLPLGPVVIIDTPGIDDEGELGIKRVGKSRQVLNKTDLAILVVDATTGTGSWETEMIRLFEKKEIPYLVVYNKADLLPDPAPSDRKTSRNASQAGVPTGIATGDSPASDPAVSGSGHSNMVYVSAKTGFGIHDLKERMARLVAPDGSGKRLVADLIHLLDVVILVVPIDKAAPKGRLILPQQQAPTEVIPSPQSAWITGNPIKTTFGKPAATIKVSRLSSLMRHTFAVTAAKQTHIKISANTYGTFVIRNRRRSRLSRSR